MIADSSTLAMPSMTVAVGGDHLARGDDDLVAEAKGRARHVLERAVAPPVRDRLRASLAQLVRLRLAASLGDGLGEVGEEDGEPQPDRDEPGEEARVGDREDGDEHAPDLDHEHDRVAHHPARIELEEALARRPDAGSRGRAATGARCEASQAQVLQDRAEREHREVGERDDDQDDADEQRREERRARRERAG